MSLKQALPLIEDMVAALAAAHEMGIVHRDFKPGNVMLVRVDTSRKRAVVNDFGLALSVAAAQVPAGVGTPEYMAPEQAAGSAVGAQRINLPWAS